MTMLKKTKTSLPAVLAVALIALSIAGFSYAHWCETLTLNGTITSGEVKGAIVTWYSNDPGETIDPNYTKHVATTTCWINETDPHYAYVTIENAYPSYEVKFTCDIKNTGTIPWLMQTPKVNGITLVDGVYVDVDLDGDGLPDANFMYIDGENKQVEPGGFVEFSLRIHIKQTATPGTIYTFTITVDVCQWNLVD